MTTSHRRHYVNLISQGAVYFASLDEIVDESLLQRWHDRLRGTSPDSSFDKVYAAIMDYGGRFHKQDDVVDPFRDSTRSDHVLSVFTFDIDNDVLRFDTRDHRLRISLRLLRQSDGVPKISVSDFEPYQPPARPKSSLGTYVTAPRCIMRRQGVPMQRLTAFLSRLLGDFAFQWRHVLWGRYNEFTLRKIVSAVVKMASLDFKVRVVRGEREEWGQALVSLRDLPEWHGVSQPIVRAGSVSIIPTQHPHHAVQLAEEDIFRQSTSSHDDVFRQSNLSQCRPCLPPRTYLIVTGREIMLYRWGLDGARASEPERLFDWSLPPSGGAVRLLLQAFGNPGLVPSLQNLPVEVQEMILDHVQVSDGPIERARLGCLLEIGFPFDWKWEGRDIDSIEACPVRRESTPVESHIEFDGRSAGVAYGDVKHPYAYPGPESLVHDFQYARADGSIEHVAINTFY